MTDRARPRWRLDPESHPFVASVLGGALFALLSFALGGLMWADGDRRAFVTAAVSGLVLWGPFTTVWARRRLRCERAA